MKAKTSTKIKLISQGAEAKIYADNNNIIKERIKKTYRIKEIDLPLRKFRTKREAKVIEKLALLGIDVPSIRSIDKDKMILEMDLIQGKKIRDKLNSQNYTKLCTSIGKIIAKMHSNGIIHGDLTTSNMLLEAKSDKIFLIDFGLSFFSSKIEDKAVDIHLFKRALESKHNKIWEKAFKSFLSGYKKDSDNYNDTLIRLDIVEQRGRNKKK